MGDPAPPKFHNLFYPHGPGDDKHLGKSSLCESRQLPDAIPGLIAQGTAVDTEPNRHRYRRRY